MNYLYILLNFLFVQNLVLTFATGLVPALGRKQDFRYTFHDFVAGAVIMFIAASLSWGVNYIFVDILGLSFLRTLLFVIVLIIVLAVVTALGTILSEKLQTSIKIFTAPVSASCAVLSLMIVVNGHKFGFLEVLIASIGAILGYGIALLLYSAVLRRMELEWIPRPFRGVPIALISLGIIALIFMTVSALILPGIRV